MSDGTPRYTTGQVAMLVIGAILLLPGACALAFIAGGMWEMVTADQGFGRSSPSTQMALFVWAISFAITAAGVVLIVAARRRARIPR